MIFSLILLMSCDVWENWSLPNSTISSHIIIQKNKETIITLQEVFKLENQVLQINNIDASDTSLLAITEGQNDTLILWGKDIGSATISATFESEYYYDALLNIEITDGYPVDTKMGETSIINLSNIFNIDSTGFDSIAVLSPSSDVATINLLSNGRIEIYGVWPGELQSQIELYFAGNLVEIGLLAINVTNPLRALVELFTNSGCINCPVANEFLDDKLVMHDEYMSIIRYHAYCPEFGDIMYHYNTPVNQARLDFYMVPLTPYLVVNGNIIGEWNEADWEQSLQESYEIESPLYLNLGANIISDSLIAVLDVIEVENITEVLTLSFVLIEDSIEYAGTNGEILHQQVMRKKIDYALADIENGSWRASFFLDDVLVREHLSVVAYVQNNTKVVYQSTVIR